MNTGTPDRGAATLRQAVRADVSAIQRVRRSVKENRLTSTVITDADVIHAIEETGRGWVIEHDRDVVAFAIGNAGNGNIWALFVDPAHEGRGYGRVDELRPPAERRALFRDGRGDPARVRHL